MSPGVLRISSDGDDQRIFWGLKFSLLGFFWVRKFISIFFVWFDLSGDLSRDFLGIQNKLMTHDSAHESTTKLVLRLF